MHTRPIARLLRSTLPDGAYHITSRAVPGLPLFTDTHDRRRFLTLLTTVATRHRWRLHAYCLMGTHYHLIIECTQPQLSAGMQQLNGTYAQRYNTRHGRWGHVFGQRYSARAITGDSHLATACAYIIDNPRRANLVQHATDWPWTWTRHHPTAPARAGPAPAVDSPPPGDSTTASSASARSAGRGTR